MFISSKKFSVLFKSTVMVLISIISLLDVGSNLAQTPVCDIDVVAGDVDNLIIAINTANNSNGTITICLQSGTYTLTQLHNTTNGPNGLPPISGDVVISGNNSTLRRASSAAQFRIFAVTDSGNLTVEDLTITGGNIPDNFLAGAGIGVFDNATLTITNSTIFNNEVVNGSSRGGGIFIANTATANIINSTISNNQSSGISSRGTVTISGSRIENNYSSNIGGGMYIRGTATIDNSVIASNSTDNFGGGLFIYDGTVNIINSNIYDNSVNVVSSNYGNGGGIHNESATVTIAGSTISENTSTRYGGGISNSGSLNIYGSCIQNNYAHGIYNYPTAPIMSATTNWWGASDGPSGAFTTGSGNSVTSNILYTPYQSDGCVLSIDSPPTPLVTLPIKANMGWQDTGVDLIVGSAVTINANNFIRITPSDPGKTPDGDPNCFGGNGAAVGWPAPSLACWSLIGRIGNGSPFAVGTTYDFTAPQDGRLYLGVNDDTLVDNSLQWLVSINVTYPTPTPPTAYEYAIMSKLAYAYDPDHPDHNKKDYYLSILAGNGWEPIDEVTVTEDANDNIWGYWGVAFYNQAKNHLVIAHRGTNFEGIFSLLSWESLMDAISDTRIFLHLPPWQFDSALAFATTARTRVNSPQYFTVSHTGHSLGGTLAEIVAACDGSLRAVTFDSPGSKPIFPNIKTIYPTLSCDLDNLDVNSYLGPPNVVNTTIEHVGEIRLTRPNWASEGNTPFFEDDLIGLGKSWLDIGSPIEGIEIFNEFISQLSTSSIINKVILDGYVNSHTFDAHSLDVIIGLLSTYQDVERPEIGVIVTEEEWPTGLRAGFVEYLVNRFPERFCNDAVCREDLSNTLNDAESIAGVVTKLASWIHSAFKYKVQEVIDNVKLKAKNVVGNSRNSIANFGAKHRSIRWLYTGSTCAIAYIASKDSLCQATTNTADFIDSGFATVDSVLSQIESDPPDPNYTELARLSKFEVVEPVDISQFSVITANLTNNINQRSAILQAFLTSFERMQGATVAGDPEYIQIQAVAVHNYLRLWHDNQAEFANLLRQYANTYPNLADAMSPDALTLISEWQTTGISQGQATILSGFGLTAEQISTLSTTLQEDSSDSLPALYEWADSIEQDILPGLSDAIAEIESSLELTSQNNCYIDAPSTINENESLSISIVCGEVTDAVYGYEFNHSIYPTSPEIVPQTAIYNTGDIFLTAGTNSLTLINDLTEGYAVSLRSPAPAVTISGNATLGRITYDTDLPGNVIFNLDTIILANTFGKPIQISSQPTTTVNILDLPLAEVTGFVQREAGTHKGDNIILTIDTNTPTSSTIISEQYHFTYDETVNVDSILEGDAPGHLYCSQQLNLTDEIVNSLPLITLLAGDVNNDDAINITDGAIIVSARIGDPIDPAYTPDLNEDGLINILDLIHVGRNFGKQQPIVCFN